VLLPSDDLSALLGYPVHGIIGMTFLRGSRVYLDFPGQQIGLK
jgi:hypothetical protein